MIAAWMLYCSVLALFLGGGALLGERALHALRLPTRRVWAAAMAAAVVIPELVWVLDVSREGGVGLPFVPAPFQPFLATAFDGYWICSVDSPHAGGPVAAMTLSGETRS